MMDEFGFGLEQVIFKDRVCRVCNKKKNLLEDFYLTRKDRKGFPSAYSYECKTCTVKRITSKRKSKKKNRPRPLPPYLADYPDW